MEMFTAATSTAEQQEAQERTPTPEELKGYLDLTREEVERLILYLLVQDALQQKLGTLPDTVQVHAHKGIAS